MHTFCKSCITDYEESGERNCHHCPECNCFFFRKDMSLNHTLADIVEQWKHIDNSVARDKRARPAGPTFEAAVAIPVRRPLPPRASGAVYCHRGARGGLESPFYIARAALPHYRKGATYTS